MSILGFRSDTRGLNRSRLRRSVAVLAIGSAVAAGGGALMANAKTADPAPINPPSVQAPVPGLADLVEQVRPAVVSILVEGRRAGGQGPRFDFPDDERFREFFERFFGQRPGQGFGREDDRGRDGPAQRVRAAGSGFIVSPDGFVVTNNHLVGDADEIKVILDDGTEVEAELKGTDPKTDLALLKLKSGEPLPYVEFGTSENTRAGDWVVAIGNPFGLGGTVTTGIVSARGRDINAGPYDDFLQIDAPINRGNSGGPLFDLNGRVVGVNTAIFSPSGGNIGIGFAIPADQARSVIDSLKEKGYVARGKLGVQIQTVTPELADGLGLEEPRGAVVSAVVEDSPAEKAGIRVGDVIVGFNGENVEDAGALPELVANAGPGAEAEVTVLREGERRAMDVTLAAQEQTVAKSGADDARENDEARLGVMAAPVNDETRARFDLPESVEGTVVIRVQRGSPAARAGLRPGDVILQVNGETVGSPQALARAVADNPNGLVMLVNRGGNQWFTSVEPESVG